MTQLQLKGENNHSTASPGPKKPESLSQTLKYSHWKNPTLINEQLTAKQKKIIEALLLTNTIVRAAKRANVSEGPR